MKLTNNQIYTYAQVLSSAFANNKNQYLPAKINFYIQKNTQAIVSLAREIEDSRIAIIKHYGVTDKEGNITVPDANQEVAKQEYIDLLNIEQEVKILPINIEQFGDINLSIEQMNAILFMIEGE